MTRGWWGVALMAALATLGCHRARALDPDGGRDAPADPQADTDEAPVDALNSETDEAPVDALGSETSTADSEAQDASADANGAEVISPLDLSADSSDGGISDAPVNGDASEVCVPGSDGARFVDHLLGTDDATHGNGPGPCAFRTLTYALGKASDLISLSAQDFYKGGVAGETLPFLLTGNQHLACNGATLANEEDQGTYAGIVQFAGTRNGLAGCHFDGRHLGGYCLIVNATAAEVTRPHAVTRSTFTACDNVAVAVPDGFDNLTISENTFALNFASVYLEGSHANVGIVNNIFVGNSKDVICDDAAPGVSGSGNIRGGGVIACEQCGGCPFGP